MSIRKTISMSMGTIGVLREDVAEVIANEGVEIDANAAREINDALKAHFKVPIYIVVNRLNHYSYSFEAMQILADLEEIAKIAFVSYSSPSETASHMFTEFPRAHKWEGAFFSNREKALEWLVGEVDAKSLT